MNEQQNLPRAIQLMTDCNLHDLADDELAWFGVDTDDLLASVTCEHDALNTLAARVVVENLARACLARDNRARYLLIRVPSTQGRAADGVMFDTDRAYLGVLSHDTVTGLWLENFRRAMPPGDHLIDITDGTSTPAAAAPAT